MPIERGSIHLTETQQIALDRMNAFVHSDDKRVFILKGYAGTGKTTLVKALISRMNKDRIPYSLLASTGRAAKVLTDATRMSGGAEDYSASATTIHSLIYSFSNINQDLDLFAQQDTPPSLSGVKLLFSLKTRDVNLDFKMTYIIDEASMISDTDASRGSQAQYGTEGRLLKDLLSYDPRGRFIFIGDPCQLPPVNQLFSPALSVKYFSDAFQIAAEEFELTEIVRQASDNDIPVSASRIRRLYFTPPSGTIAWFPFRGYNHIHILGDQNEMLAEYIDCIRGRDYSRATLVVFSNRSVSTLSAIIRRALGFASQSLSPGDLLLVTQNNMISGLMNGDLVRVVSTGLRERRAGLTFLYVQVESLVTGTSFSQLLIEEVLNSGSTNLTPEQQTHLMIDFHVRMKKKGLRQSSAEYVTQMRTDIYLNALRCIFGYALTCHKSQGGEWDKVFLEIPRGLPYNNPRSYAYQWVYTAMTRARQELYVLEDYWVR